MINKVCHIKFNSLDDAKEYICKNRYFFKPDGRFNDKSLNHMNLRLSAVKTIEYNYSRLKLSKEIVKYIESYDDNIKIISRKIKLGKSNPDISREGTACHIAKGHAEQVLNKKILKIIINSIKSASTNDISQIKRNKYGELRIVISKVVNMNFKNRLLFIIIDIKDNSELELFHTYYQKYRIKYC
jgi:hypothetical protein